MGKTLKRKTEEDDGKQETQEIPFDVIQTNADRDWENEVRLSEDESRVLGEVS